MTDDPIDSEDENTTGHKKSGKGETDGSFGDGKAGAASGMGMLLSTAKGAQVNAEHRHLVGDGLIEALVEFCSDGLMRATAHLTVVWEKTYTIINSFLTFCSKELPKLARGLQRTASRDGRGVQKRKQPGHNLGMDLKPSGPNE
jgi:hypothetical protein